MTPRGEIVAQCFSFEDAVTQLGGPVILLIVSSFLHTVYPMPHSLCLLWKIECRNRQHLITMSATQKGRT